MMTDAEKIALLREALIAAFEDAAGWLDDSRGVGPEGLECYEMVQKALRETE